MSLKNATDYLASLGRYGDDSILHVSHKEIEFLENLAGGALPRNPDTGAKEAFFFLPFLAPLAGAAAPAAAAGAGALAAGLQTGMAAAGTAAGAIGSAAGAAGAGLGSLLGAGGAAASTLPTAASAAGGLGTAGLGAAKTALDATTAAGTLGSTAMNALPAAVDPIVTGATTAASTLPSLPATTTAIPSAVMSQAPLSAAPVTQGAGAAMTAGGASGASPMGLGGIGSPVTASAGPWGAGSAPAAASAGTGAFPSAPVGAATTETAAKAGGLGGLMGNMDMSSMMQGLGLMSMMGMGGGGGGDDDDDKASPNAGKEKYEGGEPVFPDDDYEGGIDPEWDYFPKYKAGGLVKGYAKGGKVSADASDEQIVQATVDALQGKNPNPEPVIQLFVETFGQQALQDLMQKMGVGAGLGAAQQSNGLSDSVPAMIDGKQPAALSEGEYVIPADVVSGLGNGSTDAGAQVLDGMAQRTRAARGTPQQPPAIDPRQVMPA